MQFLGYFISHKEALVVASLKGAIGPGSAATLEKCVQEILEKDPKLVVLHLGEIVNFEKECYRGLIQLQKEIRDHGATLHVTGLDDKNKHVLSTKAVVRAEELRESLKDALKDAAVFRGR